MSQKHPIIAVTGASGAGKEPVCTAFKHLFWREKVKSVTLEGEAFHRYTRDEMKKEVEKSKKKLGRAISHFGPEGNILDKLEAVLKEYGEKGTGQCRHYLHNDDDARDHNQPPGTFTRWEPIAEGSDLLFYDGLHGGYVAHGIDIPKHIDLLIGVTPIVNLEWIQKIHRDSRERGYSREAVMQSILDRMHDYVHYITPQFSHTHINFQRVSVVDTSHPFIARDVPTLDESYVVIRFRYPKGVDFPYLLRMIHNSFMSRPNTIVIPGGKQLEAMEIILLPLLHELMEKRKH